MVVIFDLNLGNTNSQHKEVVLKIFKTIDSSKDNFLQPVDMLSFNFIFGSSFISHCFKLIIITYHTPKQREIKVKPRIKSNHNRYLHVNYVSNPCCISFNAQ